MLAEERRACWLLRACSALLVLFAIGHTLGSLGFAAPTPEGRDVFAAMQAVHFEVHGERFSYGGFYTGFAITITLVKLFLAWLAWKLSTSLGTAPQLARTACFALAALHAATAVVSWLYFSWIPLVMAIALVAMFCAAGVMLGAFANVSRKATR